MWGCGVDFAGSGHNPVTDLTTDVRNSRISDGENYSQSEGRDMLRIYRFTASRIVNSYWIWNSLWGAWVRNLFCVCVCGWGEASLWNCSSVRRQRKPSLIRNTSSVTRVAHVTRAITFPERENVTNYKTCYMSNNKTMWTLTAASCRDPSCSQHQVNMWSVY